MNYRNQLKRFLFLLLTSAWLGGQAQYKYEKEARVGIEEVPQEARSFFSRFSFEKSPKWYKEQGYDQVSFEAKLKAAGKRYSIEFSQSGIFEDVEIEMPFKELDSAIQHRINSYLQHEQGGFRLHRCQVQYSGSEEAVLSLVTKKGTTDGLIIKYELVISTKSDGRFKKYEYLFDSLGKMNEKAEIVLKMSDNLEY